jgi:hypothetical protein
VREKERDTGRQRDRKAERKKERKICGEEKKLKYIDVFQQKWKHTGSEL